MDAVLCGRKIIHAPPAHLKAEEAEDQQQTQRAPRPCSSKPLMHVKHIRQPCSQRPCLLRVPVTVVSPGFLGPQRTGKHAKCQEGHTYIYKRICRLHHLGLMGEQSVHSQKECTSHEGIGKHIDHHMRYEPRALKSRHECLVMNLRPEDIDHNEDRGKDS